MNEFISFAKNKTENIDFCSRRFNFFDLVFAAKKTEKVKAGNFKTNDENSSWKNQKLKRMREIQNECVLFGSKSYLLLSSLFF